MPANNDATVQIQFHPADEPNPTELVATVDFAPGTTLHIRHTESLELVRSTAEE
jgi:hypothetical protein